MPKVIRFPGGTLNPIASNVIDDLMHRLYSEGYSVHDWNVDSTDAHGITRPVSEIVKNSMYGADFQRAVILMHDTDPKTTTVEALPIIIEQYLELGYEFDTLEDEYLTEVLHTPFDINAYEDAN